MDAIKLDLNGTLASQIELMVKENMITDIGMMASAMTIASITQLIKYRPICNVFPDSEVRRHR